MVSSEVFSPHKALSVTDRKGLMGHDAHVEQTHTDTEK